MTICFDWLNLRSAMPWAGSVFNCLKLLFDLILTGLFRYFPVGSYLILNNPANCWISYGMVYCIPLGFRLTMDFLLTSLTIILLLLGRFWLDLADVARLKNLFWLFEVDLSEVLEQWLICDF